jgi:monolysocardiolipin acyltransferase
METNVPPIIIPMWITGFNDLMPEGRAFPYKYLPKLRVNLSVTFGNPYPAEDILCALQAKSGPRLQPEYGTGWLTSALPRELHSDAIDELPKSPDLDKIRSELTAIIQRGVEDLGRRVSGNTLGLHV